MLLVADVYGSLKYKTYIVTLCPLLCGYNLMSAICMYLVSIVDNLLAFAILVQSNEI